MVDNSLETIINQEASNSETEEEAYQWDDRHPLLPGILLVQPWFLNLSFPDPARMEIALVKDLLV